MALNGRGNGQEVASASSGAGKEQKLNVDRDGDYGWSLVEKNQS